MDAPTQETALPGAKDKTVSQILWGRCEQVKGREWTSERMNCHVCWAFCNTG